MAPQTVTVDWSETLAGTGVPLPNAQEMRWIDQLNDTGIASIVLQNDDPALASVIIPGHLRFYIDDVMRFCGRVEQIEPVEVEQGEEADLRTRVVCRGLVAEFEDVVVFPPYGVGRTPYSDDRPFNFAEPSFDDSAWFAATELFPQWEQSLPPDGLQGNPEGWPDGMIEWIWSSDTGSGAPSGTSYFRYTFYVLGDDTTACRLFAAFDNRGKVYVDGVEVVSYTGSSPLDGWQRTYETDIVLDPGEHVIAVEATNDDIFLVGSIAALLVGVFKIGAIGLEHPPLAKTSADWDCVDFPTTPPGWTAGAVLLRLLAEAQARGVLTNWTFDFTATVDSDGNAWPTVTDIAFRVGDDYLKVIRQLAETHIDFDVPPESRTLRAWVAGMKGTARTTTYTTADNITELTRSNITIDDPAGLGDIMLTEDGVVMVTEDTEVPMELETAP